MKVDALQQPPIAREKRMRAVEIADRPVVRDHAAVPLAGKPGVQVERRRLDLERGRQARIEIERDRVIGRRANGRWNAGERGQRSAMDVAGGDQAGARVPPQDGGEIGGIVQVCASMCAMPVTGADGAEEER